MHFKVAMEATFLASHEPFGVSCWQLGIRFGFSNSRNWAL